MYLDMMIAGSGGQGVLLIGKLLAWAGMLEGMHVTWFPSYGAEMRGGTANCTVIISDEIIGSPIIQNPGTFIIMNNASLERFEKRVKPQGIIIINSSLVKRGVKREDVEVVSIPANEIADEIGDTRVANMVMVGALIGSRRIITVGAFKEAMKKIIPSSKLSLLALNEKALELGYSYNIVRGKDGSFIPVLS
jgi:2-oxoglutarate ferredoxin oxidoreductase subunit gamma